MITRDRATMPSCALARLRSGEGMPGLLVLRPNWRSRMGEILLDLILICECTEAGDWEGRIEYLPL